MKNLDINLEFTEKILVGFIKEEVKKSGFNKVVLGLSGGIDSSLVAYLAAKALGKENVLGVMMPYKTSSKGSLDHAELVAIGSGIRTEVVEITDMLDAYFKKFPDMTDLRKGNKMARERMTILYDFSAKENALVLGTSNKTELLLGYGTQHGDMASAINPIGDLYKTQVWDLSRYMGVPKEVIEKKPSADLWEGQSDEQDLGFTYAEADKLLYLLIDERYTIEELKNIGYSESFVKEIYRKIKMSQYKRKLPLIAKVSKRTIDKDFRYPRDWEI
ncbi:NAD+ synthase [Haliovirga abyssi]|uniref:NH(3)-dependent NAD(+) synthetase n=1 Tax=Haliovirga abyssi TaxID=2996794 RepID=A0AAU9E0P2_9FUSO|nr:NAD+ synthase [Haliovirga abyssi]BDU49905.1 NH(3)-dependent NAD(+) synthetase [Haliovirga abyssi]